MSGVVSGIIGGIVATCLMHWLVKRNQQSQIPGKLNYGSAMGWLSGAMLALTMVFFYALVFTDHNGQSLSWGLLITSFSLGTIYLFLEWRLTSGRFNEEGIQFQSIWRGRRSQSWNDLEDVCFSASMSWLVLTFRDGTKIRISTLLNGHGDIADFLVRRNQQSLVGAEDGGRT